MKHKIKKLLLLLLTGFSMQAQNVLGIDISHHQGDVNWTLVANDGKVFAFVKATEGFTYDDPNFQTYMTEGNNAGVVMGAYHFARPDNNSATDEANHFVSVAHNYIGAGFLPPVLDLEDPNSSTHLDQLFSATQLTNWVQTWMDRVEALTGVKPVIYLNSNYANYLHATLNNYPLWIAKPGTSPDSQPNDIGNWNDWEFKQYSWTGSVNGISGDVDLDSYNGSAADFNQMLQDIANLQVNSEADFRIFPNPGNGIVNLTSATSEIDKIEIYNTTGQLLQNISLQNQTDKHLIRFTVSQKGIFFIKITGTSGNMSVIKYIVH